MMSIRRSDERGSVDHGWLQARHSFSFGRYYDAEHMGVSSLRVINDDRIAPRQGFPTHSHQDMEILTYVTAGSIEHKDNMGNTEVLSAGEFQLMSAGTGISHSEYNPSSTDTLSLFQIWIKPDQHGIEPGYQQKKFVSQNGLQLIASPDGLNGSFLIHQDTSVYRLKLEKNHSISLSTTTTRSIYIHVVSGVLDVEGRHLSAGDAATVQAVSNIIFNASNHTEALVFDLP